MARGAGVWVDEDRTVEIPVAGARRRQVGRCLVILAPVAAIAVVVSVLVAPAGDPPGLTASGSTIALPDASSPFLTQVPTSTARPTTTSSTAASTPTGTSTTALSGP